MGNSYGRSQKSKLNKKVDAIKFELFDFFHLLEWEKELNAKERDSIVNEMLWKEGQKVPNNVVTSCKTIA